MATARSKRSPVLGIRQPM